MNRKHPSSQPMPVDAASSWQTQMDAAFAAFLSAVRTVVQTEQLTLRPVVITYIADAPPTLPLDAFQINMPSLWQSPVHSQLDVLLKKAGFSSITHIPLSADQPIPAQTDSMLAQLSALNDPQVLVLCTPTYVDLAEKKGSALHHMLLAFDASKQGSLLPLMIAGDFAHAARIVPNHCLLRDWQPALAAFNGRTGGMPALIDLFCSLSVGLLPDLLGLSNTAPYATHLAALERIQARATTDDILSQDLNRQAIQHALYPHLKNLPTPRLNPNHKGRNADLPPNLSGLVQQVLEQPAIKTALLLGASAVDTELTGLALIEQLRHHPKNPRIITLNLGQYPRQAAQQCLGLHLDHILKLAPPLVQDLKEQRLDDADHTRPTVWVLTNYQHIGTYLNIYVANALASWQNTKVLVTCTAQYFDRHDAKTCFLSDPTNPDLSSFLEYPLSPFASHIIYANTPQALPNLDALHSPRWKAQQAEWDQFLNQIQPLAQEVGKAFISYAPESGAALTRQQGHLRQLAQDLGKAGIPTWLDVARRAGDMKPMQQNIENSRYAIIIGTPRYTQQTMEATNIKRAYDAIIQRYRSGKINIIALSYLPAGTFPSFPTDFPNALTQWNIQDIDDFDRYISHMTDSTQGILPHMLGCAVKPTAQIDHQSTVGGLNRFLAQVPTQHRILNQIGSLMDRAKGIFPHVPGFAEKPTAQITYPKALHGLRQSLTLLPAQHLILNQAEQDQMVYEVPSRRALYIEARGSARLKGTEAFSLTQAFHAFLADPASECPTFVVLGAGGSGKSLFAQIQYARLFEQWRDHRRTPENHTRPDWIPVYIPLKHYVGRTNTCVTTALQDIYHCHDADINHLKTGSGSNLGVLLIFDGFDELGGQTPNLYQVNGLDSWQCPVKLLITTRVDTVPNPDAHQHIFGFQGEDSFKRAYIQPCSREDIKANYECLASLPGLLDLLRNDSLPNLVLPGLPYLLAKRQKEATHQAVTRLEIYDAFAQYWFGDDPALRSIFESQAEGLAFGLYLKKALSVSETQDPILWKRFIHDEDNPKVAQAMAALPLRSTGDGRYEFMHKTLWAYFTFRYVVSAYQRPGQPHPNPEALMHALAARPVAALSEKASGVPLPIQEKGVYSFFHDALHAQANSLKAALFEQISRSRLHADQPLGPHALASAHAATLLAKSGISMASQSWAGVQLPGADLSDAQLCYANLQGAAFQGAYLGKASLWGADMQQAHLEGVRFGEMPPIQMDDRVKALALHPTQPWVAASVGKHVVIKHRDTHETLYTLEGHTDRVTCVAFSPRGGLLVSGSDDWTLRLWHVEGSEVQPFGAPLSGHTGWVTCVAFSPNGGLLVSGSFDNTLRLWQVEGSEVQPFGEPLSGHTDKVTCVAFSPRGGLLVSGSDDWTLRLWHVEGSEVQPFGAPLSGHTSWVTCVAFSPRGGLLVSGSFDNTLRLWQVEGSEVQPFGAPLSGHERGVTCVAFSPSGGLLVSGSFDNTLRLWQVKSSGVQSFEVPFGHARWVTCVAFSPSGGLLVSGSFDNTLCLWQVKGSGVQSFGAPLIGHKHSVNAVTFSPSGALVVSGSGDKTLHLWQVEVLGVQSLGASLSAHAEDVTCVAFSPSGRLLVSGSLDKNLRLWQVEGSGVQPFGGPLIGHADWVTCVAFSPNGKLVVSGSRDNTLSLWDLESSEGQLFGAHWRGYAGPVTCVAFSPCGGLLVSGSEDCTLRLWQIKGSRGQSFEVPLSGHTDKVTGVAFSPIGGLLVSGSRDKTLRLWQIKGSGGESFGAPLSGHTDKVNCVAFSPGGSLVVSGGDDCTFRVWGIQSMSCIQKVDWASEVMSIALSVTKSYAGFASLMVGDKAGCVGLWYFQDPMVLNESAPALRIEANQVLVMMADILPVALVKIIHNYWNTFEDVRFVGIPPQPGCGTLWRRMWSRVALSGMRLSAEAARLIAHYRKEEMPSLPFTVLEDNAALSSETLLSELESVVPIGIPDPIVDEGAKATDSDCALS